MTTTIMNQSRDGESDDGNSEGSDEKRNSTKTVSCSSDGGKLNTTFIKRFFDPAHGDSGPREKVSKIVSKIQRVTTTSNAEEETIHYWRAKMFLKIAKLYTDKAYNAQKKPRKFFLLYRGFDSTSSKDSLVEFKKNYLQLSLSSIERALDLQQHYTNKHYYYECLKLKAHILCTFSACDEYSERRRCEQALECLLLLNELEGEEESDTKKMIMHIAHAVAEKNGSWENLVRLEKRFEEKEREEEKQKSAAQAKDEYKDDYSNYFNELEYDEDDREALESIIDSIIIRQ